MQSLIFSYFLLNIIFAIIIIIIIVTVRSL